MVILYCEFGVELVLNVECRTKYYGIEIWTRRVTRSPRACSLPWTTILESWRIVNNIFTCISLITSLFSVIMVLLWRWLPVHRCPRLRRIGRNRSIAWVERRTEYRDWWVSAKYLADNTNAFILLTQEIPGMGNFTSVFIPCGYQECASMLTACPMVCLYEVCLRLMRYWDIWQRQGRTLIEHDLLSR